MKLPRAAAMTLLLLGAAMLAGPAMSAPAEDFRDMRGANYVPSHARNDVQLWMDSDPQVIDRGLGYAARLKLNTARVFLQYAAYERDPKRLLDKCEGFLGLCQEHGIRVMPVVLDSCFGELPDLQKDCDAAEAGQVMDAPRPEAASRSPQRRWTREEAWQWSRGQPWLVDCNFLPSSAVNDVEMWQKETFDAPTIDRELGWARSLGFNTVRVFLNFVVWRDDPAGTRKRFGEFLQVAARHGISVMPVLLDDCNFAGRVAATGKQPDPVPGVHNSQWVSSPPLAMVTDRAAWPRLEAYIKDVTGAFGQDRRVVVWDLYNEPGNSGMGDRSLPLLEAAFAWARQARPVQPLTAGAWADFNSPLSRRMMELSDVVSFHAYDSPSGVEAKLTACAASGRPLLCTEWLVRRGGNTFENLLPFFKQRKIGCWSWGLVAGRTQTYFPWGSPKGAPEPAQWQHDILRKDGTPYRPREVRFIQVTTGKLPASALPRTTVLVPTAEKRPVACRYTTAKPADGWFRPEFDDAAWRQGAAPFGKEEPAIGRRPNTAWSTADLWVRREFEMPAGKFTDLALALHHDEDTEVYLNGVLAVRAGGYNAAYESFDIAPEAQAALKPGRKNLLAVHCRQTAGGQYLDLGIEGVALSETIGCRCEDVRRGRLDLYESSRAPQDPRPLRDRTVSRKGPIQGPAPWSMTAGRYNHGRRPTRSPIERRIPGRKTRHDARLAARGHSGRRIGPALPDGRLYRGPLRGGTERCAVRHREPGQRQAARRSCRLRRGGRGPCGAGGAQGL